jgi:hypothetical protein
MPRYDGQRPMPTSIACGGAAAVSRVELAFPSSADGMQRVDLTRASSPEDLNQKKKSRPLEEEEKNLTPSKRRKYKHRGNRRGTPTLKTSSVHIGEGANLQTQEDDNVLTGEDDIVQVGRDVLSTAGAKLTNSRNEEF